MRTFSLRRLALAALLSFSPSAFAAAIISVNFTGGGFGGSPAISLLATDLAGVVPAGGYNNVPSANTASPLALQDADGLATTMTLAITGSVGPYSTISGAGINPQGGDEKLNTGFLAGNSTLTLSAIPYASYDLYVYTLNDNESRIQTTTVGGLSYYQDPPNAASRVDQNINTTYPYTLATSTSLGSPTANANYVRFTGLSGAAQTVTVFASGNGYINGFQVVATPEPTAIHIAAAGGLALLGLRRRGAKRQSMGKWGLLNRY